MVEYPTPNRIIADVIRQRRTIHQFRSECPPRELVLRGIELARWAPNHKHTEPWRFHLLGPETKTAIVELNARLVAERKGPAAGEAKRQRWSAVPGWLAVTCDRGDDAVRNEEDYAACCCAIQNLSLFLWSEGVGVKWSTGDVIRHTEFHRLIGADPLTRRVVALLWYGYPEQVPEQKRRPVGEIVVERP
ncbi:MAG: nitroreductase family protein [Planctomycetaceae bacterium]